MMNGLTDHSLGELATRAARRTSKYLRRRANERAFVAYYKGTVASGGGTINLHIANDTGDGVLIDIERFLLSSQFEGEYTIHDAFSSAPTGGTVVEIDNLRMDSAGGPPDSGQMTANHSVAYTSNGVHFSEVLPSGGTGANTMGGAGEGTEPLIEPGREIVIELQNDSSAEAKGSIGVVYTEVQQDNA